MALYRIIRSFYHTVFPERFRLLAYDERYPLLRLLTPLRSVIQRLAHHDELYDKAFFQDGVEPVMSKSAGIMARSILDELHPGFVVDVGCGTGGLLLALKQLGVQGVGFEYAMAAIEIVRSKGLRVIKLDLEQPIEQLEIHRGDLGISTEVAEHLPERFADTFVDYLCRTSDTVLLTAAIPGQGGHDHVNEQPNEYWIEKFLARGFLYDGQTTRRMRREWKDANVAWFYHLNLMIFRLDATG